jgi:sensor histidine kinase YesM
LGSWFPTNEKIWQIMGYGILFGLIVTPFFFSRKRLADTMAMAQEERLKRLSSEKLAVEADLKRLQAQIEPHFLFNTLSNILSLMDTDLAKAKSMQLDLIRYLRTSLGRTRNQETTLQQEVELIQAYLDIFKIRMGERLEYEIDIPATLLDHPLPPMLLQPLVENAIIHGLEPKIDGGKITLSATMNKDILEIDIADTGNGLCPQHRPGVGLANVKKRLAQLYGEKGRLIIRKNQPRGVLVQITVPYLQIQRREESSSINF